VNRLIDFPKDVPEFVEFVLRREPQTGKVVDVYPALEHDARRLLTGMRDHLEFLLRAKDALHVRAWLLHFVLDYVRKAPSLTLREVLERSEEKVERASSIFNEEARFVIMSEWEVVRRLVEENGEEILRDCRPETR